MYFLTFRTLRLCGAVNVLGSPDGEKSFDGLRATTSSVGVAELLRGEP